LAADPASGAYWVNDALGDPLSVVTAQTNASLTKVLPELLQEVRRLVGSRRVTFVFDRGGYSLRSFQQILAAGFDLLTYRKGRYRHIPRKAFHRRRTVDADRSTGRHRRLPPSFQSIRVRRDSEENGPFGYDEDIDVSLWSSGDGEGDD